MIFTAVADALQWIMQQQGVSWVWHYVDDFIMLGAPSSRECAENVVTMHRTCEEVGMPVEPEKDEGPATENTFLRLKLDTEKMEIRLPQEKLKRLKRVITGWGGRKAGKKRDLLSLIGLLTQASRAVRPGRAYVRRLINLSTMTNQMDHYVRINREARADMEWWHRFLGVWNGTAMMFTTPKTDPDITLTSDASIVVSAVIWGPKWKGKTILARCDNAAVVAIVNSGTSKNP